MAADQKPDSTLSKFIFGIFRLMAWELESRPSATGFGRSYDAIRNSAAIYRVVDYHDVPEGHYEIDFNRSDSTAKMRNAIDDFRPDVILCMETLEHINYHFEVMNEIARSVTQYGSKAFITLPNNGNWILNALGFNHDHIIAFYPSIARRFIQRSDLGKLKVTFVPCTQKYVWFWWLIHWASIFQPFNLGFLIEPLESN